MHTLATRRLLVGLAAASVAILPAIGFAADGVAPDADAGTATAATATSTALPSEVPPVAPDGDEAPEPGTVLAQEITDDGTPATPGSDGCDPPEDTTSLTGTLTRDGAGWRLDDQEVSFGPPWWRYLETDWQDTLTGYEGTTVTLVVEADDTADPSVFEINGTTFRANDGCPPPWAGGPSWAGTAGAAGWTGGPPPWADGSDDDGEGPPPHVFGTTETTEDEDSSQGAGPPPWAGDDDDEDEGVGRPEGVGPPVWPDADQRED